MNIEQTREMRHQDTQEAIRLDFKLYLYQYIGKQSSQGIRAACGMCWNRIDGQAMRHILSLARSVLRPDKKIETGRDDCPIIKQCTIVSSYIP